MSAKYGFVMYFAKGMTCLDLQSLPVGVALPLLDMIRCCREAPPTTLPLAAYDLIGREDVAQILGSAGILKTPCLEDSGDCDGMNLDLEVSGCGIVWSFQPLHKMNHKS